MENRIIYINDGAGLSVIVPAPEAVAKYGIEAIAKKDVPAGKPYKVVEVNAENFPVDGTVNENGVHNIDKTFRAAWTVDLEYLTDGVGADYGAGSLFDVIGYSDGNVIVRHRETGEVSEVKA